MCKDGFKYLHLVHCRKQNLTYLIMGIPLQIFIRYFHMTLFFIRVTIIVFSSDRKIVLQWKYALLPFWLFAFTITLLASRYSKNKSPSAVGNSDDVTICTSTVKTFKKIFSSRIGAFTRLKRKNNKKNQICVLFLTK